jgi:LuxR family maltose regulon positive regulatory protein
LAVTERPKYVRLCLAQAWAYIFSGQYDRAELVVPHAEAHLKQPENLPPEMPESLLVATVAALRAYIATRTSRLDEALHQSDLALAALDSPDLGDAGAKQTDSLRGSILLNWGITHHYLGDDGMAAEQAYLAALPFNRNRPFALIANYSNFMRLRQSQGRFDEAIALGQEGLQWIDTQGGAHFPAEAEIREKLVAIYTERNDLAGAEKAMIMLNGGHYLSSSNVIVRSHVAAFRLHLAQGNFEDATTVLGQAEEQFNQQGVQSQNGRAALMRMKLGMWRVQGSEPSFLAEARRWMETSGLTAEGSFPHRDESIYATLAQVLLALGDRENALSLLKQLCTRSEKAGRLGDLVGHQIVYAVALDVDHQRTQALTILEEALSLGEQLGAVRSFVDEGAPLHTLLRTLPSTSYRNQILGAFDESTKVSLPPTEQNLIEPLSQRELEVLQLLAGGYANQEIASELIIALSTVKRHVSNIYGKLDVNNRTTAVARARELDLL